MKRQMESLQERVSGAPSDIGDIRFDFVFSWNQAKLDTRDRMEDLERDVSKKVTFTSSWHP